MTIDAAIDPQTLEVQRTLEKDCFRAFLEHSPAIAFIKDQQGRYVYFSPTLRRMIGTTSVDPLGATDFDLFPHEVALQNRQNDRAVLESGQPLDFLERLPTPEGATRYWSGHKFSFEDSSGKVCIAGVAINVTDQYLTEVSLREETTRLSAVIDTQQEVATTPRSLEGVMDIIVRHAQNITRADAAAVELVEGDDMVYKAASGFAAPFINLRLKKSASLSGRCIRENRVLRCDDAEEDERVDKEACRRIGIRSLIVVPLLHEGVVVGVLKVMAALPNIFHECDIATLQLMAGLVAAAMSDAIAREAKQALLEERLQSAVAAQENEERFRSAIDASLDSFFILRSVRDAGGTISDFQFVDLNVCAERMLMRPRTDILKHSLFELFPMEQIQPVFERLVRVVETRKTIAEDGPSIGLKLSATWLHYQMVPFGDGVAITCRDITERKEFERQLAAANAQLEILATHDSLTGLKNRRAFQEALSGEFARWTRYGTNEPISLILIDVDHFKRLNDTFSHLAGDQALVQVATVLKDSARVVDLVARYGGEEFVIVMSNTDYSGATASAERFRAAIKAFPWSNMLLTISIGVSTTHSESSETALIAQADAALYASKRAGRNRVTHFDDVT